MSQHVDFLKSIPKAKTQLPADWMIAGIATSMVLLILVSTILWIYQITAKQHFQAAQLANQKEMAAFQKLATEYPLLAGETPLVTKVLELEKNLHDKEAYFETLTHTTVRKPFSQYLIALSQAVPEGLWLTGINIDQDSGNISLEGQASSPSLISIFLKQLEQIPPFVGVAFDLFAVKKKTREAGSHQFEIANIQLLNEKLTEDKKGEKQDDTQMGDAPKATVKKMDVQKVDTADDDKK